MSVDAIVTIVLFTILAVLIIVPFAIFVVLYISEESERERQRKKKNRTPVKDLFHARAPTDEVRTELAAMFDVGEDKVDQATEAAKAKVINIFEEV